MTSTRPWCSARTCSLIAVSAILALATVVLDASRLEKESRTTGAAVLNFSSIVPGMRIYTKSAKDHTGRAFPEAGSFGPSSDPINGGKAMGSAPGTFGLPTWVEFTWHELPYPGPPREAFATYEAWGAYVDAAFRAAPLKTARVKVAEKVPASALEEVAISRASTPPDKLPDKMLWLYFIWTSDGIKVRWKVDSRERGTNSLEGGDKL